MRRASLPRNDLGDPFVALAAPSKRRTLDRVVGDPDAALPIVSTLWQRPPQDHKQLAFLLAWSGRVALGAHPTLANPGERTNIRSELARRRDLLVGYLDHPQRAVAIAATLAVTATAIGDLQSVFADCAARTNDRALAHAARLAASVLARITGEPSHIGVTWYRPGMAAFHSDSLASQLAGRAASVKSLIDARFYGERELAKLPWFPGDFTTVVRRLILERPPAERESAVGEALASGPINSQVVELLFAAYPPGDHPWLLERDRVATLARRVLLAPEKYGPGLRGTIPWLEFRLPPSSLGRAILVGDQPTHPLAIEVGTERGAMPLYCALYQLVGHALAARLPVAGYRARVAELLQTIPLAARQAAAAAAFACRELVEPHALAGFATRFDYPAWPT